MDPRPAGLGRRLGIIEIVPGMSFSEPARGREILEMDSGVDGEPPPPPPLILLVLVAMLAPPTLMLPLLVLVGVRGLRRGVGLRGTADMGGKFPQVSREAARKEVVY